MHKGSPRKIPTRKDGVWGTQPKSIISKAAVGLPLSIARTAPQGDIPLFLRLYT
jgi:hypothetical protein